MNMEAADSSEMLVPIYCRKTARLLGLLRKLIVWEHEGNVTVSEVCVCAALDERKTVY